MSIHIMLPVFISLITLYSGFFVYKKYKLTNGFFYLIFTILFPLWFLFYFLSFITSFGSEIVLMIYRFQYSLSLIGFYSILFFVLFFGIYKHKIKQYLLPIWIFFGTIIVISNFTPFILSNVYFSKDLGIFVEVYGVMYILFVVLYLLLFPLFLLVSVIKIRSLRNLDRIRISYIIGGFVLFLLMSLIFHVFIPYIFSDASLIYVGEIFPLYILPFVGGVVYSSYKYDFSGYKLYLNKIFVYIGGILFSLFWLLIIHIAINASILDFTDIFKIEGGLSWLDIISAIILFTIFYNLFKKNQTLTSLEQTLISIQEKLPFITNIHSLNDFLKNEFRGKLNIQSIKIENNIGKKTYTKSFFENNTNILYIVNDFVFLENNKHKIQGDIFVNEINKKVNIVMPLLSGSNTVGALLLLGKKRFGDAYTTQELKAYKNFCIVLQSHLKYLGIYSQIQELTVNLDKRVDEKTIEYNNLLSKQKEFIAYVGHEIKNPITNSLFLTDALKDSASESGNTEILEDSEILYDELIKVSKLVKYIFSAEKFDLDKIKLYKKQINISRFLEEEVHSFHFKFPNIKFHEKISGGIKMEIDEIQFRQVIQNLINNAIKFTDKNTPEIFISLRQKNKHLIITVEDNGKSFKDIKISNIFDKYATGTGDNIGLGMGLYLCKKIVELHGGKINAKKSLKLDGACFSIEI